MGGKTNGFPSLSRTTPLGSFLRVADEECVEVEVVDSSDVPSAITKEVAGYQPFMRGTRQRSLYREKSYLPELLT